MSIFNWFRRKPAPVSAPELISAADLVVAYHFGYTPQAWRTETVQTKRLRREQYFHARGL